MLLLMSPWLVGFSVFFGYPLVMSAYLSFNHYDLLGSPRWVGLANYRYLFTVDPQVWTAIRNTLWIIAVAVRGVAYGPADGKEVQGGQAGVS